jgi:hypothetical protein
MLLYIRIPYLYAAYTIFETPTSPDKPNLLVNIGTNPKFADIAGNSSSAYSESSLFLEGTIVQGNTNC